MAETKGEFDTPFGPQRGDISVSEDQDGKKHYRIKCDPIRVDFSGGKVYTLRCSHPQCLRTVELADPPSEEAKGWHLAPIGQARCPDHPFEWMQR